MATGTEPFTITLHVSMAFEDGDHYTAEDVTRYARECLRKFPGLVDSINVIHGRGPEVVQPASVVEIRIPASEYAELTEDERMFTVDGDRYIVTAGPDETEYRE